MMLEKNKPDYEQLYEDGIEREQLYLLKGVYEDLPQEEYDKVVPLLDPSLPLEEFYDQLKDLDVVPSEYTTREDCVMFEDVEEAIQEGMYDEEFLLSPQEAEWEHYSVLYMDSDGVYVDDAGNYIYDGPENPLTEPDTYLIKTQEYYSDISMMDKNFVIANNIPTREDAEQTVSVFVRDALEERNVKENALHLTANNDPAKREVSYNISILDEEGGRLADVSDFSCQDFVRMKTSGLETPEGLTETYNALSDMAYAMDIELESLSLNGQIGIVYDGAGVYEPNRNCIHTLSAKTDVYGDVGKMELSALYNNLKDEPATKELLATLKDNREFMRDQQIISGYTGVSVTDETLFVKAGQAFINNKCSEKGIVNDYLNEPAVTFYGLSTRGFVNTIEQNPNVELYPHDTPAAIDAFENYVGEIKDRGFFNSREENVKSETVKNLEEVAR